MVARRHNQINFKAIRLLVVFLLLSQCLSLAHATEHFLNGDEPICNICQLNSEHNHATTVVYTQDFIPGFYIYDLSRYKIHYHSFNRFVKSIRAPPSTPVI